jgi:3-oxoacyl-[acyl-carrier protein] reductase
LSTENILITGASSDLARELIRLITNGGRDARIFAHFYQGKDRIDKLKSELKADIVPIQADLRGSAGVEHLIAQLRAHTDFPQKIIHLAGLKVHLERFHQADLARFDDDFAVQVRAVMRLLQEFLPAMAHAPQPTKVVLVLSSVTVGVPAKYMATYTVIKHAELGLIRALAADHAGGSVNINGVSPYMTDTQFLSELPQKAKELAAAGAPHGRLLSTRDVVKVIEFLLSPASDHLSGVNIPVTGGIAS